MVQELIDLSTGKVWRRTLPDGEWSTSLVDNGPYVRAMRDGSKLAVISKVIAVSNGVCANALSDSEIKSLIGRSFNRDTDGIAFANGDVSNGGDLILGATFNQLTNGFRAYVVPAAGTQAPITQSVHIIATIFAG